jgi:lycopene cyclase domain-containing protein
MARHRHDAESGPVTTALWPGVALVASLWLGVGGLIPASAAVTAVLATLLVSVAARRATPNRRPRVLVAAVVLSVGAVAAAALTTPLAGVPLPDIGILGRYTYLATEVLFGAITALLLARAGRETTRSVARTVAAVYPVAYLWDWYTLEVGVFAIPLRTGVEFVGIPLEEHLFMVVVPAFVLAVHETIVQRK